MKQSILITGLIVGALVASDATAAKKTTKAPAATKPNASEVVALGAGLRRMHRDYSIVLSNGCVYRANVTGTIEGAREHGRPEVRFEPDLHVTAVIDCPREPEARVSWHIGNEHLGREDLDEAIRGAMSVPMHGCFYAPDLRRDGGDLVAKTLVWSCPSAPASIGGGPKSIVPHGKTITRRPHKTK